MAITFTSVADFGLPRTAELLTRAFAGYFVRIAFTEAALREKETQDSVVLADSLVLWLDGEPAGAALIARRGAASRVAGMALVPGARRQGAGRALLERILTGARARGDRRVVLEVIGQNEAAVRLYEAAGFVRKRRLLGFAGTTPAERRPAADLREGTVGEVAAIIARQKEVDWPWQISSETIAQLPAPATGCTLDGASLVLMDPSAPVGSLRVLVVEGDDRREERAARLLRAVRARYGAREWRMSALCPEEFAPWLVRAGLSRTELYQWQMQREG